MKISSALALIPIVLTACSAVALDPIPASTIQQMVRNCEQTPQDKVAEAERSAYCACVGRGVARSYTETEAAIGVGPDDPRMGEIKASCRR